MGYLVVENFGAGLDSRKSFLTTPAGALLTCKNAHITRGKEIEKRKKFALFATLPSGTFGLHAASGNIYTFGSEDLSGLMPSGVQYQRLVHPTSSPMTELIFSESFNGKVYAIAKFATGDIYHYFDGTRVTDWDYIASSVASTQGVASFLADQIDVESNFQALASGNTVIITGPVNTAFTVAVSNFVNVTQTQAASPGVSQITTVTIYDPFQSNQQYFITLGIAAINYSKKFSITGSSSGAGRAIKTFGQRMYSTTQSFVYFSTLESDSNTGPTNWSNSGTGVGSGFINILNQDGGAENLTALAVYQGKLSILSRRSVQIYQMDPDPSKMIATQTLSNIGTFAPRSVVAFGDVDVFFLSDSGVRSLRARDASNAATVADIGTAIDTLIQKEISSVSESLKNSAIGIIEPTDGRFWLAIGSKIFVFSYFTGSSVAAWSTYEPGFVVESMVYSSGRIYVRGNGNVYLYGGASGNEYDDCEVEVTLPYLDGGKPATLKTVSAFDMGCEGTWDVYVGCDISQPETRDYAGTIVNATYAFGNLLHFAMGSHVGVKLVNTTAGYARLSNFAIHFEMAGAG
jgi:hypothetical protein